MRYATGFIILILIAQFDVQAQTQDPAQTPAQPQGQGSANRMAPVVEPFHPAISSSTQAPPTANDRVNEYIRNLVNPFSFVGAAASAGIGQWRDKPKEWGEGGNAYAHRAVSAFTQHIVYSTLLLGSASLFQEDNRFIPSGQNTFGSRVKYGIESTFLATHWDANGQPHRRVYASRIVSLAGAALISRLWQPHSTAGLRSAAVSFGVSIGAATGLNVTREFLPGFPQ